MRILIVGENAGLRMGGEANIPYFFFKLLRERGIETWMVSHSRVRDELRERLPSDFDRIHFVEDTRLDRFLTQIAPGLNWKIRYQTIDVLKHMFSQLRLRRLAARLVRSERIDLVHQVYPLSPKAPSAMFGLGVPVIIGPLSGGMTFPPGFQYLESRLSRVVERGNRLASHLFNWMLPGTLRADTLIVANSQTRKALPLGIQGLVCEGFNEVSFDSQTFQSCGNSTKPRQDDPKVRFIYLGRLIEWKAVDLLLEAFRKAVDQVGSLDLTLEILGTGSQAAALADQVKRLRLESQVHFAGWVSPTDAAERMQHSDVFVLPSLRECGGIALLEAMSMGLPVITTNWGGPADHVDDASGIRVEPTSCAGFIDGIAEAMVRLARSPDLRARMGEGGRERVKQSTYIWDRKIDRILEIYRETLARTAAACGTDPSPKQPDVVPLDVLVGGSG